MPHEKTSLSKKLQNTLAQGKQKLFVGQAIRQATRTIDGIKESFMVTKYGV